MSLPNVLAQVWRLARIGGVAALAQTQGATHVNPSADKALILVAAVAGVEAIYRAAVPAKEKTKLDRVWAAVKQVLSNPVVASEVKVVEAKVPAPVLTEAEQAIADAGHTRPS